VNYVKNKILIFIILIISIFLFNNFSLQRVDADSGWDTDYDSSWDSGGSSWDNDYDYGYDYDDDYDYNYDYDYDDDYYSSSGNSSSSNTNSLTTEERNKLAFQFIIFIITTSVIPVICFSIIIRILRKLTKKTVRQRGVGVDVIERERRRKEYLSKKSEFKYDKLTVEQATKIIPGFNIEEFNFKAYQMFYDTQIAWMNFDYDKLKSLLTDELYNTYVMDLESLKLKNQKNTMKEFKLINSCIFDLKEENEIFIAKVFLNVEFYDYIENVGTGNILRGSDRIKVNNAYVLTLTKLKNESNNMNYCPRCGAPIEANSSGICEYCKSKLVNQNFDWVISKKEKVSQNEVVR